MKKVVSPSEVAHLWANKVQSEARTSSYNFYFEGDTIYSYGRHFPIAIHKDGFVLFTKRRYSNTTAKHISCVAQASSHLKKVYCYNPHDAISSNLSKWNDDIKAIIHQMQKARKKELYFDKIQSLQNEAKEYCKYMKYKPAKSQMEYINYTFDDAIQHAKKIQEKREKELKLVKTKGKKVYEIVISKWKQGYSITDIRKDLSYSDIKLAEEYHSLIGVTPLRIYGGEVVTFKNVHLPIDVAKRYAKLYEENMLNVGDKILHYTVSSVSDKFVDIGCHKISRDDIKFVLNFCDYATV